MSKNHDLQQLGADSNIRAETRRAPANVPSTTERLLRHRQRLQADSSNAKSTARSFQALFPENNYNPTQRTQAVTAFEKRRKNLVQLIANNFGNVPTRTTLPTYTAASTYRTTAVGGDFNNIREMQVAAETASFANNNNRQYLQDFNNKNYRPYPVYTPNLTARPSKTKSSSSLTTLYDIRDKHLNLVNHESTSKRPTLVPYTKSYTSAVNENREPYTRPGVSLLKDFIEKEKNKTQATTTEKFAQATERSDLYQNKDNFENKITIDTKDSFESATKIPLTTRTDNAYFTQTASSDRFDVYSNTNHISQVTTEPSYQERRERLMRKLNLNTFGATEPTTPTTITEKFYGDLPNRPGLIVPPSLTPKTLHTLAIYYATALDNLSTTQTPEDSDSTTPAFDEYETMDDGLPALFSRHTINKYSNLFGHGVDNSELLEEIKLDANGTYNELADDLAVQQSQNPLATSPQIRELAQVFTHALSAYLQDPVQFRKVLSDIRPTHPSFGDMLTTTEETSNTEPTTTINEEDDEILGFSDDNKSRPALASLRDAKSINIATDYPIVADDITTTPRPFSTELSTTARSTTPWTPFKCCGRISASYTSASTPKESATTPVAFTNTVAADVNVLANNYSNTYFPTTENSYIPKYGGFQNNTAPSNSPYGNGVTSEEAKPLNEYVEVTNLPTAWGIDSSDSTLGTQANTHTNIFESKKITTSLPETTPVYFTETDSIELENEEELQRAHSQSFVTPQNNNLRQGKQVNFEESKTTVRKPSEELEAPTLPDLDSTTVQTTPPPTTVLPAEDNDAYTTVSSISSSVFTSPDNDKTTYQFQWPSTFENWQSTVIDPITLNDNLSPSGPESQVRQVNIATTPSTEYTGTSEQAFSSSINIEQTTNANKNEERLGRLLRDPTSTEPAQDLTTITDTVVEKAKEIMGGMNATTTEKLMNVMKKTKSKTVRRLILLLVQTCDDDHNTTAEASKKALLEALMAVSQKDMDEIAKEEGVTDIPTTNADYEIARSTDSQRRTDKIVMRQEFRSRQSERKGKSLNFDPSAINSLSNPSTPESIKPNDVVVDSVTTTQVPKTTTVNRRGVKKFYVRTTPVEPTTTKAPSVDSPIAEARTAPQGTDLKTAADTRALELLRSLYTIAARWG